MTETDKLREELDGREISWQSGMSPETSKIVTTWRDENGREHFAFEGMDGKLVVITAAVCQEGERPVPGVGGRLR